jgi:ATP phosphoribosyltransferase-like protein
VDLLEDAGLGPEQPGERALAFPCRNAPVEVLLVRAEDVPEYVQDGVVDCGITGADLVRERGVRVRELLRLGFGGCTLEAAVPAESPVRSLEGLDGIRVATADGASVLAAVLRSVVDARGARYLMLNAPEGALPEICGLVPGSRAPTVLPLAEPGMVAVHALVPASDVWHLLPRLREVGASSILLVPVERLVA